MVGYVDWIRFGQKMMSFSRLTSPSCMSRLSLSATVMPYSSSTHKCNISFNIYLISLVSFSSFISSVLLPSSLFICWWLRNSKVVQYCHQVVRNGSFHATGSVTVSGLLQFQPDAITFQSLRPCRCFLWYVTAKVLQTTSFMLTRSFLQCHEVLGSMTHTFSALVPLVEPSVFLTHPCDSDTWML